LIINGDTSAQLLNVLCDNFLYDNKVLLRERSSRLEGCLTGRAGVRLMRKGFRPFFRRFSVCCGKAPLPGEDLFSEVKFWDFEIRTDCFVGIMAGWGRFCRRREDVFGPQNIRFSVGRIFIVIKGVQPFNSLNTIYNLLLC
jgi:hypothetical protein